MLKCLVKEESVMNAQQMRGQSLGPGFPGQSCALCSRAACQQTLTGGLDVTLQGAAGLEPVLRAAWPRSTLLLLLARSFTPVRKGAQFTQWSPTYMQPEGSENTCSWAPPLGI